MVATGDGASTSSVVWKLCDMECGMKEKISSYCTRDWSTSTGIAQANVASRLGVPVTLRLPADVALRCEWCDTSERWCDRCIGGIGGAHMHECV